MKKIEDLLQTISVPIALPSEVVVLFGKKRKIPDFDFIFSQVLPQLNAYLKLNGTARMGGEDLYLFPLLEEGDLAIKLEDQKIVEISVLYPSPNNSKTLQQVLNELKQ